MASRALRMARSHGKRLAPAMDRTNTGRSFPSSQEFWRRNTVTAAVERRGVWELSRRALSTAATSDDMGGSKGKEEPKSKKDDSNIFLDNLGKIFLALIGAMVAGIVRSSKGRNNKIAIRDVLEEETALDPLEIDDLRVANSHVTPELFKTILYDVKQAFPSGSATYDDFVKVVRITMKRYGGDACTIELGHLLDRAVLFAMKDVTSSLGQQQEMPIAFFLTALSLTLYSPVPERITTLYTVLEETKNTHDPSVKISQVVEMVGYLQKTCQLIPDAQIVEISEQKYPIQQYEKGTASDLLKGAWEGNESDPVDLEAFSSILCARSVCAWGECHNRKLKVAD